VTRLLLALMVWVGGCVGKSVTEPAHAESNGEGHQDGEGGADSPFPIVDLSLSLEGSPYAEAARDWEQEDWGSAVDAFRAVSNDPSVVVTEDQRQSALLLLGLSQLRADQFSDAAATLESFAATPSVLRDYALLSAADAASRVPDVTTMQRCLEGLQDGVLPAYRALLEALLAVEQGDHQGAVPLFDEAMAGSTGRNLRRAMLMRARSLLALEKVEEAAGGFRALVEAFPSTKEGRSARRELDAIPSATKPATTKDPLVEAQALFGRHRSDEAIAKLEGLLKTTKLETSPERWCEANMLMGKSYTKLRKHDKAAVYYDLVVGSCADADLELKALYNGGRAHWNANEPQKAIDQFEALIAAFPEHSYADDAYLYIARIQDEQGKAQDAERTLLTQLRQYPEGDMAKDAHWLLFLRYYRSGDYAAAAQYAESVKDRREDDLYSRGRVDYFHGRALEHLKKPAEAQALFEAVIEAQPLSYYALLSLGRLKVIAPKDAEAFIARLREFPFVERGMMVEVRPVEMATSADFVRGIELLRLGLDDWAEVELEKAVAAAADKETANWTLAAILNAVGSVPRSHRMAAQMATLNPRYFTSADEQAQWALAYPRPFLELVEHAAQKQGLAKEIIYSIMREESGFEPGIESWANARGLMQLMLPTAQSLATQAGVDKPDEAALFVPSTAIPLGSAYLSKLSKTYNQHPAFIIAGYNGGQGNVNRWLQDFGDSSLDLWVEQIPFGQTRDYTKRVLTTYWRYGWIYNEVADMAVFDPSIPAREAAAFVGE